MSIRNLTFFVSGFNPPRVQCIRINGSVGSGCFLHWLTIGPTTQARCQTGVLPVTCMSSPTTNKYNLHLPSPCANSPSSPNPPLCRSADVRKYAHEHERIAERTHQPAPRGPPQPIPLLARSVPDPQAQTRAARVHPRVRRVPQRPRLHRAHQQRPAIHPPTRIRITRGCPPRRPPQRPAQLPSPRRNNTQSRVRNPAPAHKERPAPRARSVQSTKPKSSRDQNSTRSPAEIPQSVSAR